MSQARRWFQHPQGGAAGGYDPGPVRAQFVGCLRRFACSVAQHFSLSEQIWRMSQAIRWFQHLRGAAGGGFTGSRSRHFVGMSQAVWQFSGPASPAFGAHEQEGDEEEEEEEETGKTREDGGVNGL